MPDPFHPYGAIHRWLLIRYAESERGGNPANTPRRKPGKERPLLARIHKPGAVFRHVIPEDIYEGDDAEER